MITSSVNTGILFKYTSLSRYGPRPWPGPKVVNGIVAGYDVKENQSGQKTGKTKITKKGNAHIRRAMHLPAFNVVKYNVKPFRRFYDRLFNRSGIKMKAYTAVQSKLLRMMYTLWKTESVFDEDFQNSTLSGDQEVKLPLPVISGGNEKN